VQDRALSNKAEAAQMRAERDELLRSLRTLRPRGLRVQRVGGEGGDSSTPTWTMRSPSGRSLSFGAGPAPEEGAGGVGGGGGGAGGGAGGGGEGGVVRGTGVGPASLAPTAKVALQTMGMLAELCVVSRSRSLTREEAGRPLQWLRETLAEELQVKAHDIAVRWDRWEGGAEGEEDDGASADGGSRRRRSTATVDSAALGKYRANPRARFLMAASYGLLPALRAAGAAGPLAPDVEVVVNDEAVSIWDAFPPLAFRRALAPSADSADSAEAAAAMPAVLRVEVIAPKDVFASELQAAPLPPSDRAVDTLLTSVSFRDAVLAQSLADRDREPDDDARDDRTVASAASSRAPFRTALRGTSPVTEYKDVSIDLDEAMLATYTVADIWALAEKQRSTATGKTQRVTSIVYDGDPLTALNAKLASLGIRPGRNHFRVLFE
jgi:hypothetical protein